MGLAARPSVCSACGPTISRPHPSARALCPLRLEHCSSLASAVSGITLLSALLASARRVAGYDPNDVLILEGEVPAGAVTGSAAARVCVLPFLTAAARW